MINWIKNSVKLFSKRGLLAFCLLAAAGGVSAQTCSLESNSIAQTLTTPLVLTPITATRDLVTGVLLASQTIGGFANAQIRCPGSSTSYSETLNMESIGLTRSAFQDPNNTTYETNVPGVGVYFQAPSFGDTAKFRLPFTLDLPKPNGNDGVIPTGNGSIRVYFIKIGDIKPGRVTTAGWPVFSLSAGTNNQRIWTLTIAGGSWEIVSQTCTTPNQLVPLGDRPQTDFKGVGTGSPFKDFVIELKNCPAFHGTYQWADQRFSTDLGAPTKLISETTGTSLNNDIRLQLTVPAANIVSPGILKLGAPTGGGHNATGVGIEIRQRGAASPIEFNRRIDALQLKNVGADSTQTIPLSARLVQTAAQVTPGQANGSVEFLINYQ